MADRSRLALPDGRASLFDGRIVLVGARVVFAASVVAAGWFGWGWYSAASAGSPSGPAGQAGPAGRAAGEAGQLAGDQPDRVLQAAEQAVLNVSSLDYRHIAQGIRLWKQSSTGPFLAGIVAGQGQLSRAVAKAKTITSAKVLDGALTSLRTGQGRPGTATFIVAEQTTVTAPTGTPSVTQYRLQGQLIKTASGWKLSSLHVVPTGAAAPSPGTTPGG